MRAYNYRLSRRGEPVPEPYTIRWGAWFERANRHVALTEFLVPVPDPGRSFRWRRVQLSTVFLGIDHNFLGAGQPILWETMGFGEGVNDSDDGAPFGRFTSRADAARYHAEVCAEWRARGWLEVRR